MFLLRAAFWLTIVVLLIPGDPGNGTPAPRVSAFDAILAARGAVADLSGMCSRQPDVCVHGGAALEAFGAKARYGASLLYETIDGKLQNRSADADATGTLTPTDSKPVWQAPERAGGKA